MQQKQEIEHTNHPQKKKNVGIEIPPMESGGQFQLALSIADSLLKYSHTYTYEVLYRDEEALKWLSTIDKDTRLLHIRNKRKIVYKISAFVNLLFRTKILKMTEEDNLFKKQKSEIDLLIVPYHWLFGFAENIPYIVTITSIMQKYYTKPPDGDSFKDRLLSNFISKNAARFSILSVVDSRQGMDDLQGFYGISRDKIRIIPHMPSGYIYENRNMSIEESERILNKYRLPNKYIMYPAGFWNGKNHVRLLESLIFIKRQYQAVIPLVLLGRLDANFVTVQNYIKKLLIEDQVYSLGYVSDKEIVALYKKSTALVYPSLLGPTNIPPLEAMILGTPVLCSNLFAMPEQIGDAGLLFDPLNIEDMAQKIYRIWTDENLRNNLRQKGYERIHSSQENYARMWEGIIEEVFQLMDRTRREN